jgi:hypothetical protein
MSDHDAPSARGAGDTPSDASADEHAATGSADERTTDDPTDPPPGAPPSGTGAGQDVPAGADGRHGATGDGEEDDTEDDGGPSRQALLEARAAGAIPRPPKRTGVFLDADDLRVHVGELLRAMLGGFQVDAWGNFTFTHEDARVFVTVGETPIGPQVGVFSITNVEIELTHELSTFLLTTNHKLGFGSFSYDPESRSVWLRHTLLGTTLDGPELQSAVAAVASTAAGIDDVIRDRFGGRAFHDAPEDIQSKAKPPSADEQGHPNASGYL